MKKLLLSLSLTLACLSTFAQRTQDVVHLHNGSIIKGDVIEHVPGGNLKIRTADGSVFVYNSSEIEKIENETIEKNTKEGRHRGLDFNIDAGWHLSTNGNGNTVSAEIGLGKRFNKNFYWGIGSGIYIPTGDNNDPQIPITSDFKVYFPLKSSSIVPGGLLRVGYVINTAGDITVDYGRREEAIEVPDAIMLQIMPSMQIPVSKKVDFNLAVGYTHMFPTKGGEGSGAFSIKTGFSFHKSDVPKPQKPTRDKGMQLTVEGGNVGFGGKISNAWQGNIAFTYKLNPKWSFGIGGGYEYVHDFEESDFFSYTSERNGEIQNEYSSDLGMTCIHTGKIFARGTYRFTDAKLSPYVTCDAGMRIYSFENNPYDDLNMQIEDEGEHIDSPSMGFYAAPAVGLSLRITNNSYLELKVGYSLVSPISKKSIDYESGYGNRETLNHVTTKSLKLSAPFASIGFTHTFNWGENWF